MSARPTLKVQVRRQGNRATAAGSFGEIFFEVDDPDFVVESDEFAVWATLPIAMASGARLVFDAPIDPVVAKSAHRLSRIWNAWLPRLWQMVDVEAEPVTSAEPRGSEHVMAYSGGVDSTYALLRHHEALNITRVFTILGFDYRPRDAASFATLLDKNRRTADTLGLSLTVVRTNVFAHNPRWTDSHMTNLSAVAWLFAGAYSRGHLASDFSRYQDFVHFPFGSNGVTNRMFQGREFGIDPLGDDITRREKIALLLDHPEIARRLTFCPQSWRTGRNCERCDVCLRNKLECLALADTARPIFSDDEFGDRDFERVARKGTGRFAQMEIRDLWQSFLLKDDRDMARRLESMIVSNAEIQRGRDTPPQWWRINLNLRNRLGLRKGQYARARARKKAGA